MPMDRPVALALAALLACGGRTPGPEGRPIPPPVATAEMMDASGAQIGIATFASGATGARLALSISGIPPGQHGIHIHETGACEPPGFTSAGGHFNPGGRQHGLENPEGPHAGDLPNLTVEPDGSADVTLSLPADLLREGDRFIVGAALVIHAGPDDLRTDPSGNSGDRIACGVIRAG